MSIGPVRLRATPNVDDQHFPHHVTAGMNVVARSEKTACKDALRLLEEVSEVLDYAYLFDRGNDFSTNPLRKIDIMGRRHIPPLATSGGNTTRKMGVSRMELTILGAQWDFQRLLPYLVLTNHTKKIALCSHHVPELTVLLFDAKDPISNNPSRADCVAGIAAALYRLRDSVRSGMKGNGSEQPFLTAIMGLEALFAPPTEDDFRPVSSTVALGAAYASLTCNTGEDRMARWQEVKKLYGCRSRIAHGTSSQPPSELDVVRARRILAESIEYCVAHFDEICAAGGFNSWLEIRGINGN